MYYCSIEDAWGNNFNKKHFNYQSNYQSNLIQENTINEEITNKQQNEPKIDHNNENISNSLDHKLDNINTIKNNTIIPNQIKSNKSDLIKNKRISLEQQIEKKIEKIYKMKDKKNKLLEKTQQLKITGGNSQTDTNNYILLGLILLFIIDVFGNLSY